MRHHHPDLRRCPRRLGWEWLLKLAGISLDLATEPGLIPVVRRQAEALLRHMSVIEEDVYRSDVLLTEACTNVVRHAYDRPGCRYFVEIEYYTGRLVIRVADQGKGFAPDAVPTPTLGQIGGYGLYFIRETADRWGVSSDPQSGTVVVAEIDLHYQT